jgi:nitrite reductase (cytochrome c-552)
MFKNIWTYVALIAIMALVTVGIVGLLMNITERKAEARVYYQEVAALDETTVDPAIWGQNFPLEYESYLRTADTERTRYGGSEAFNKLESDPRLLRIFAGYGFGLAYDEERGHAYSLVDQEETPRVTELSQPGACAHCHAAVIPLYREVGDGDVMQGFEEVCGWPLEQVHEQVEHPVACIDCHDPDTMQLRITRPGFLNGIRELKRVEEGIEDYDPNTMASRQEMRTYVCGQCHVEYYFQGEGKVLTYPWSKGIRVENIMDYYDEIDFADWTHEETGARVLKAQHPEFETFSQGIHARSGVSCADCHMPYTRVGAIKVSDHHVRSPVLNIERSCMTCHPGTAEEMEERVFTIQDRTKVLQDQAEDALVALLDDIKAALETGISDEELHAAQELQRQSQFRLDFVNAENSMGFHAPQETARILAESIDLARQGQIALLRAQDEPAAAE